MVWPERVSWVCTQSALQPAQSAAQDAIQQLARLVSQQPDLQFPISTDKAQTWLINTYLDEARPARIVLS